MTPLERAARAADEADDSWDWNDDLRWGETVARAVLMAVRDADGRALRKKVRETGSWLTAREGFTTMIDAILNEGDSQ